MAAKPQSYRTFKIGGIPKKLYPANCGSSRAMKAFAANERTKGKFARVVKSGNKSCVYTSPAQKTKSYIS